MSETPAPTLRLDVWLWRARFFRTRRMANEHVTRRGVRITRNGQTRRVDKPAASLAPGDVVTFGRGAHIQSVEVIGLGTGRGPAVEAQLLYQKLGDDDVQ